MTCPECKGTGKWYRDDGQTIEVCPVCHDYVACAKDDKAPVKKPARKKTINSAERERIRNMFDGRCAYCGRELGKSFHVDHVDPLMRGYPGQEKREESVVFYPSCRRCNLRKSMFTLEQFRSEISKQAERLRRSSNQFRLAEDFGLVVEVVTPVTFFFERFNPNTEKPF